MWRKLDLYNEADFNFMVELTKQSGSKSCKKEVSSLGVARFHNREHPEKVLAYAYGDIAYYLCFLRRNYCRGLFTIVRQDMHRKGIGRLINNHRLLMMKNYGIDTFRFRTNQNEDALKFWLAQGAQIVGVKGNDFEMELKIKI